MAEKKIVDVTGPSEAKVDIGSKPMIVGHKSMASDPMMREKVDTNTETPETSVGETKAPVPEITDMKSDLVEPPSVKQRTIEPLPDVNKSEVNKPAEKMPETAKSQETEAPEKSETDEEVKSDKATAELDETALALEKEENLRKIIESNKYHVNIKQSHGENKSWAYVVIGLIFTALIALFILVDTGKLDIGIKLPFSIFGSEQSQSNTAAPTESLPAEIVPAEVVYVIKGDYSLQIPETWDKAREEITDKEQMITYLKDTYTLPSGVKLILTQDIGGKGGVCEPDANDKPHTEGNNCPTEEYLKKTEIKLNEEEKQLLLTDYKLYLVNKRFTNTSGVSEYDLCLSSNDSTFNPGVGDPYMGFTISGCGPGVSFANGPPLVMSIEGVDNSTEEFFENEDVLAIEEVLATFRPIK